MNKRGQSIIEYVLIVVLVIFGIVIMGPYVLRSVNAHFKLWDDSVHDSFSEKLTQAPVNDVPFISTNCSCQVNSGSCGSSLPGSLCSAGQREYDYACNPQGCNGAAGNSYCQNDNKCCTDWVNTGCGTIPIGQPTTATNCNYGQEIQRHPCGTDNSIQCISNTTDCPAPTCLGVLSTCGGNHDVACPGATDNLDKNYGITYVANIGACTGQKCQYMTTCCNWQGWGNFQWESGTASNFPPPASAQFCQGNVVQCTFEPKSYEGQYMDYIRGVDGAGFGVGACGAGGSQPNDLCPSGTSPVQYGYQDHTYQCGASSLSIFYGCLPAGCAACYWTGWGGFQWATADHTQPPISAEYCQDNKILCNYDVPATPPVSWLTWVGQPGTCTGGNVGSCPAGTTTVTYDNQQTLVSCNGSNDREYQACLPTECPTPPSTSPGEDDGSTSPKKS